MNMSDNPGIHLWRGKTKGHNCPLFNQTSKPYENKVKASVFPNMIDFDKL